MPFFHYDLFVYFFSCALFFFSIRKMSLTYFASFCIIERAQETSMYFVSQHASVLFNFGHARAPAFYRSLGIRTSRFCYYFKDIFFPVLIFSLLTFVFKEICIHLMCSFFCRIKSTRPY